jgi:hypothetical protein
LFEDQSGLLKLMDLLFGPLERRSDDRVAYIDGEQSKRRLFLVYEEQDAARGE